MQSEKKNPIFKKLRRKPNLIQSEILPNFQCNSVFCQLNGQCHKIFTPPPPPYNKYSISRRYSCRLIEFKLCGVIDYVDLMSA